MSNTNKFDQDIGKKDISEEKTLRGEYILCVASCIAYEGGLERRFSVKAYGQIEMTWYIHGRDSGDWA